MAASHTGETVGVTVGVYAVAVAVAVVAAAAPGWTVSSTEEEEQRMFVAGAPATGSVHLESDRSKRQRSSLVNFCDIDQQCRI